MISEIDDVSHDKPKGTYCNILLLRVELIFAPFATKTLSAKSYSQRNTVHHILFREHWDWVLKDVTAAVQSTVVM